MASQTAAGIVYVVGNGESRKGINLDTLPRPVFGCNALYRDFQPDYLVAGDPAITEEIRASYRGNFVFVDKKQHFFQIETPIGSVAKRIPLPLVDNRISWYSGVAAAYLSAVMTSAKQVHLIGFDLYSQTGQYNNVYKDTPGYMPSDTVQDAAMNVDCHIRSFAGYVFSLLPDVRFYWHGAQLPQAWAQFKVTKEDRK